LPYGIVATPRHQNARLGLKAKQTSPPQINQKTMNTTNQINTKNHGAKCTTPSQDKALQGMLNLDYLLRALVPKFPHLLFSSQVIYAQYLNFDEFYRVNRHLVNTSHLPDSDSAVASIAAWFLVCHIQFKLDPTDTQGSEAVAALVKQSVGEHFFKFKGALAACHPEELSDIIHRHNSAKDLNTMHKLLTASSAFLKKSN
jgi:hypothetical protein